MNFDAGCTSCNDYTVIIEYTDRVVCKCNKCGSVFTTWK